MPLTFAARSQLDRLCTPVPPSFVVETRVLDLSPPIGGDLFAELLGADLL